MTNTKNSATANRREMARQSDGKFGHQHHSEANVQLSSATTHKREDHIKLGNSLATALNEFSQDFDENWEVHHNEDSQVSYVAEVDAPDRSNVQRAYDYQETDLRFSIGAEDHLAPGKITISCEAASDGHNLAGPFAAEIESDSSFSASYRSSHEADTVEEAIEWAKEKVRARKYNDAYADRLEDRADSLDDLARTEGVQVLSSVLQDFQRSDEPGGLSASEHRYNYQDVPDEVFDNAVAIHSNAQQHHFGVGSSNADELRSAYIVSAHQENGQDMWLVSHAYGVHSETEAADGYREVFKTLTRRAAEETARNSWQRERYAGSIAYTNKDLEGFFDSHQKGRMMALDEGRHAEGRLLLVAPGDQVNEKYRVN